MGNIYANALSTIIWLGEATEDFPFVGKCNKLLLWWIISRQSLWDIGDFSTGTGYQKPWISRNEVRSQLDNFFSRWQRHHDTTGAIWPALTQFLKRPWFRRMWVIQEVALASYVQLQVGAYDLTSIHWLIAMKAFAAHVEPHPHFFVPWISLAALP